MATGAGVRAAIGAILVTAFVLLGGRPNPPAIAAAAVGLGPTDEALAFVAWVGLCYYLSQSAWLAGLGYWTLYRPLVAGALVGVIVGDPVTGATVGATLSLAYLGFLGTGGALSSDVALAGYVGAAMALGGGVSATTAIALSVPFGIAGQVLYRLRLRANVWPARLAVRMARRGDASGLVWGNVVLPQTMLLVLGLLPGAVAAYVGIQLAGAVAGGGTPVWVIPWLDTTGALLGALGVAAGLGIVWTRRTAACYVVAALVVIVAPTPSIALIAGLVGAAGALAFPWLTKGEPSEQTGPRQNGGGPSLPAGRVRGRDRVAMFLTWLFFSHACYNEERLQGIGVAHAMAPILERLHMRRETLGRALVRYLAPLNVEPNLGAAVVAVMGREEESYAQEYAAADRERPGRAGQPAGRVVARAPEETGARLASAVSGVGDTVIHGAVGTVAMTLGVAVASVAGIAGVIGYSALMAGVVWGVSGWAFVAGYRGGVGRVLDILRGAPWRRIVVGCESAGAILFGLLTSGLLAGVLVTNAPWGSGDPGLATRALGALPALATVLVFLALRRHGLRESSLLVGCYAIGLVAVLIAALWV